MFILPCFSRFRSNTRELFLGKSFLKIGNKFTEENPCQSVISIKLQGNFIEVALRHGYFPVHLLHIFRSPFPKNALGELIWYEVRMASTK